MRFLSVPTFFLSWRGNPEISRSQPNLSRMPRGCEITLQGFNKDMGSVSAAEVHESSGKGGCNHKPAKIWTDWAVSSYCAPLARARREAARTSGADATAAKASPGNPAPNRQRTKNFADRAADKRPVQSRHDPFRIDGVLTGVRCKDAAKHGNSERSTDHSRRVDDASSRTRVRLGRSRYGDRKQRAGIEAQADPDR